MESALAEKFLIYATVKGYGPIVLKGLINGTSIKLYTHLQITIFQSENNVSSKDTYPSIPNQREGGRTSEMVNMKTDKGKLCISVNYLSI